MQQEWKSLTAEERRVVRSYAVKGVNQPLSGAMYARLLGIDQANGDVIREEVAYLSPPGKDWREQHNRFIDAYVKLGSLPIIYGQVRP